MTDLLAGTTPPPWLVRRRVYQLPNQDEVVRYEITAVAPGYEFSNRENARLIAAAPDLAIENATLKRRLGLRTDPLYKDMQDSRRYAERAETENARLRQENERLKADTRVAAAVTTFADLSALESERDALRSHLRDVVVPALQDARAVLRENSEPPAFRGERWRLTQTSVDTALHETQELLGRDS